DARTCRLIVLDKSISSMTEFKQIIGRGTRILEEYNKFFFTIMDFKRATALFADPNFDGDPVQIYEPRPGEPPVPPDDEPEVGTEESSAGTDDDFSNDWELTPDQKRPIKYYVDDVEVAIISERVQYLDPDGKLI